MDEDSCSDDSFILYQVKAVINQAKSRLPKKTHLIANLPYQIKQHQSHHKYLRVRLDTCADVKNKECISREIPSKNQEEQT